MGRLLCIARKPAARKPEQERQKTQRPCTTIAALTLITLAMIPMKTRPPAMPNRPEMAAQIPAEKMMRRAIFI